MGILLRTKTRTTFYVGMTNNLARRIGEHKAGEAPSFTERYNVIDLIYLGFSNANTSNCMRKIIKDLA